MKTVTYNFTTIIIQIFKYKQKYSRVKWENLMYVQHLLRKRKIKQLYCVFTRKFISNNHLSMLLYYAQFCGEIEVLQDIHSSVRHYNYAHAEVLFF